MTGWRAVIATSAPWFRSGIESDDGADRIGFARVRWSTERVCVEAVEVHANTYDLPNVAVSSYLVARFGKDPAAGHLFVGDGSELREARTCTLEPAGR